MMKIILFNMMTLDGFFEGKNGSIDWHKVDDEFNEFSVEQLQYAEGLIFGRKTYELMASYWPTPAALRDDPAVANQMNNISKIVFSRSLAQVDWENTRLVKGDAADAVRQLKAQSPGDWFIFGSADLVCSLIPHNLIDEYRIMLNPVILGSGRPLFQNIQSPLELKLVNSRTFGNGNVLLYYKKHEQ
jgi:dihydrofolate reductase